MPKTKKKPKKVSKKSEPKAEAKVSKKSELEEEISEEKIKQESFAKFTVSNVAGAPVLEKIADAPETPTVDWGAMVSTREETEEKKTSDYEPLEKTATEEYKSREMETDIVSGSPVLRTERIDITAVGRDRAHVGREFHMVQPTTELQHRDDDYEPMSVGKVDQATFGREKEQVGRKYKPRGR